MLAVFVSFGILVLTLPLYGKDSLGAGSVGVGIAMGAASLTALLLGPPSGRVADRRGRRGMLVGGAAVMVAAYVALVLDPSLPAVVVIRLVAGAGEAAFIVAAFTVVTDLAPPERRGEAISLATLASYGGAAAGAIAGDLVLGDGRFGAVWMLAAACAAVGALVGLTIPETRPQTTGEAPPGWLPPRGALLPGVILLLALLGFGGFNAFAALHARDVDAPPGVVFAVFALTVVLVRSIGRTIPDRLGARRTAAAACVGVAAGLTTIASWPSELGLFIGAAIFGAGQALAYPAVVLLAIARTSESERSAVLGAVTAFIDVALSAGAFMLGAVAALAGYRGAFLAAGAVAATGLVLLARLRTAPREVVSAAG